ncbi:MAG TPA: FAD-dependent monooxygenase [Aestuariivirga sp.]|nr:FAD-dependent monooxygenase [Aestuariivirga sp.]
MGAFDAIMSKTFDVIVVGAALNGLAAGLALGGHRARRPLSVAIIDRRDPRQALSRDSDGRASAITASSKRMFEALGVWEGVAPHMQEMGEIIVTDGRGPEARPVLLQFGESRSGEPASAFMTENHHLLQGLVDSVEKSPNITLVTGHAVAQQSFAPGLAKLTLANGEQLTCSLVVAADGGKSPLRQAAGVELVGWSYDQMGIVASFDHERPHGGRAEEHFTPAGPFAILPLPGNRSSIVWTKGTADAKKLLGLSPADFETELQNEIGTQLGRITLLGKAQGYPLSMHFAKEFHAARLALVGDAAHVIHPLAGLGLNLGLRDVAALAECVADAHALGQDIGGLAVLERYSAWRRFDTVATAASMDGLNRLFSNDNSFLRALRDLGLRATNQLSGVKQMFAREAAGQTGSLPRLLRGETV